MHDGLSGPLAESIIEIGAVMLSQIVADEGLTTVFVNSLENLSERVSSLRRIAGAVIAINEYQPCSQQRNPSQGTTR